MSRRPAPFRVERLSDGTWVLYQVQAHRGFGVMRKVGEYGTQGEAIDYAYRNWPWWP